MIMMILIANDRINQCTKNVKYLFNDFNVSIKSLIKN